MADCKVCEGREPDLMRDPAPGDCPGNPGSPPCLRKALATWRSRHAEQASLNCALVSQNCKVIRRNSSMEAVIRELVEKAVPQGPEFDALCHEAVALAKGYLDEAPRKPTRS